MDRAEVVQILAQVKSKQRIGQHIQAFMWEVDQELCEIMKIEGGGEVPGRILVEAVLGNVQKSILMAAPLGVGPWTRERLLWYADNLDQFLPASDPHWGGRRVDRHSPELRITFQNNDVIPPIYCYRCGEKGHKANICDNQRLNYLRPKSKRIRKKNNNKN